MKELIISGIVAGLLALAPVTGFAEDAREPSPDRVQIIEDDEAGIVRIVIDGQEVVLIDGEGFYVRENIKYGATITDFGQIGFDEHVHEGEGG